MAGNPHTVEHFQQLRFEAEILRIEIEFCLFHYVLDYKNYEL